MTKVTKNFSEVQEIKATQSKLDNLAKIFREGAASQGL